MQEIAHIGFLRYAAVGGVYIAGGSLHVTIPCLGQLQARPLGPISHHVRSFAELVAKSLAVSAEASVETLAMRLASNVAELRFCLTDLIECLAPQGVRAVPPMSCGGEIGAAFNKVARNAAVLQSGNCRRTIERSIADELMKRIRPPCGISDGKVFPLIEETAPKGLERLVHMDGKYFAADLAQARSLEGVCREIWESAARTERFGAEEDGVRAIARTLVADVEALLNLYGAAKRGACQIVYKDRIHELQHNGRGEFMLIRGPVEHRVRREAVFVGLPIRGKTRRQMLSVAPIVAREANAFWAPQGTRAMRPMCMGQSRQYRHLMTQQFSDAEAVVQWLDAGVIVATGRPGYHAVLRQRTEGATGIASLLGVKGTWR
jgi:hypothetical protein